LSKDLEQAFAKFNKAFFGQALKPVNFIINPSEKYGLHLRLPDVIEIGSGISSISDQEILDELLHAMVHLDNRRLGIIDFTNNQYHRKEFSEKAVSVGLVVLWHKTRGWSITHSNHKKRSSKSRRPSSEAAKKLQKVYEEILPFSNEFDLLRQRMELNLDQKPSKIFQIKYICSCDPPFIIRCGRRPNGPNPLDAKCNVCGTKFVIAEAD